MGQGHRYASVVSYHHRNVIAFFQHTEASQSTTVAYPIIADPNRELAVKFGILDADEKVYECRRSGEDHSRNGGSCRVGQGWRCRDCTRCVHHWPG